MQVFRITAFACLTLFGAALPAWSAVAPSASAAICKEAIVNPVSGHAECVQPVGAPVDPPPPRPQVVKLAVFDFELEDVSPASSLLGVTTSDAATMTKVSSEARRLLAESGRFILVDTNHTNAAPGLPALRNCGGCEARIALQIGAEQSLMGVVRRVTQTDYYVVIQIRDAQTGKVLDEQDANFAGGPDGWASGVRMLLKHQVLVTADEPQT
jgi:hypothetical protein